MKKDYVNSHRVSSLCELWIEEITEFKNYDEVKIIMDSIIRAESKKNLDYKIIFPMKKL